MTVPEISQTLGLEPTKAFEKGCPTNRDPERPTLAKSNLWFFTSEDHIDSVDSRDHLDWLLKHLLPIREQIAKLAAEGCHIDISCYWLSKHGHGGPTLSRPQLEGLTALGVDFWYDFYSAE